MDDLTPPFGQPRSADHDRQARSERLLQERGFGSDIEGLGRAVKEGDLLVRQEAARLLGLSADPESEQGLRLALRDEDARVRVEAAAALARRGDTAAMSMLRTELRAPFFEGVPLRAARVLAELGDPTGWGVVIDALRSDQPASRMEAVRVLPAFITHTGKRQGLKRIDPVGALLRAAADPEPLVREDARALLRGIDDPRAEAALRDAAEDM